jgi:two-component system nitrogen regulation sensor histidine kinase NtrY
LSEPRRRWFHRRPTAGAWWAASVAVAAIATSRWLETPSVQYLLVWALATVAAAVLAWRLRGARRRWAIACVLLLVVAAIIGVRSQRQLAGVTNHWPEWQERQARVALDALREALTETERDLADAASAALNAPGERDAAFDRLRRLVSGPDERGIVLYRGDSAFAWAGRLREAPDSLDERAGVSAAEFYLTMYATARRGGDRAVATVLLSAAPPADRLAHPLSGRVAEGAGLDGFVFSGPRTPIDSGPVLRFTVQGRPLLDARAAVVEPGRVIQKLHESLRIQVGILLAAALACFIIAAWRETRSVPARLATLGIALACVALVPLNEFSNLTRLFDPAVYFTALGGTLTANAGALGLTSAIVLLGLLTVQRRGRRPSRWTAALVVLLVAGLGPFLLRDLARGIRPPTYGVSAPLWLIWEIPLFLAAAAVLLAGAGAGGAFLGRSRGLPPYAGSVVAALASILAPIVWEAPGQWPWWYTFLWIAAIAALALGRQTRGLVVNTAIVAALGASTLVWGRTARGRVELAERDLAALSDPDPQGAARSLLERFAAALQTDPPPPTRAGLLQHYVASPLAAADYPTALYAWAGSDSPVAMLATARFGVPIDAVARGVADAIRLGKPVLRTLPMNPAAELLLAVPAANGADSTRATAVVIAPKTRLIAPDPFATLFGLGLEPDGEPPYTLQLTDVTIARPAPASGERVRWQRRENALHADWIVLTGNGIARAHLEVELRDPVALVERGTLIVLLDLATVGLLWILSVVADGGFGRWLRARRRTWARSYRLRLTIALFAFFVIPALGFAAWSYQQLSGEAVSARDVLVRETLRAVAPPNGDTSWIEGESARLDTPLLAYVAGELRSASDPLLQALAPVGRFLRDDVERLLVLGDEESVSRQIDVGTTTALFGFRSIDQPGGADIVLASPARSDAVASQSGREDLSIFVLFATAVGALGALWLSGIAARQLARPIGTLRAAALSLAAGEREPTLEGEPTVEFRPVFAAFRRMAADLNASRSALEAAQRRTAAILRNVASGVVAVETGGRVLLANPLADVLLGAPLPPGTTLARVAPRALTEAVERFLASGGEDEAFELAMRDGQQELRVRLTPITNGVVITLDDITELARAQRVLAWGEMARQVAHEIKNPLTPIRLGVQHLRRARADPRVDFDRVLEQNVNRILAEIDRLDEIARAFSRYGSAPDERRRPEPTDVAAVVRDVVALESMAGGGEGHDALAWTVEGADGPVRAAALGQELREVLLNVFENARLAGARRVVVTVSPDGRPETDDADNAPRVSIVVRDDGHGIPPDVLPRIFEPHFSTRTSGSGLGLAISRQIIDGWGGTIGVESEPGRGTTVRITLRAPDYSV